MTAADQHRAPERRLRRCAGLARCRSRLAQGRGLGPRRRVRVRQVGHPGLRALGLLPRHARVSGSVRLDGREILGAPAAGELDQVRGGRVAMIFQDPASALNPVLTIRKQLCEALALHRDLSGEAVKAEARRLLDLVGIPDAGAAALPPIRMNFFRRPGPAHHDRDGAGRKSRPAGRRTSRPLRSTPPFRRRSWSCSSSVRREMGMAMVLISHDLGVVAENFDRVAVMYAGSIVEEAPANQLFADPVHPYAQGLIGAAAARWTAPAPDPPFRDGAGSGDDAERLRLRARCALAAEPCGLVAPSLARDRRRSRRRLHPRRGLAPRAARDRRQTERAARRGVFDLAQLQHAFRNVRPEHGRPCGRRRVAHDIPRAKRWGWSASPVPASRPPGASCSASSRRIAARCAFDGRPTASPGTVAWRAQRGACR